MGTGTSRSRLCSAAILWLVLAAAGLAACGSTSQSSAFSSLHPQSAPADWKVARIPSGAALAYPPSWRVERGDRGTATAALLGSHGRFLGYLNLTPQQGDETQSNWSSFRVDHNREEGDRVVKQLAAAHGLRFLTGHGSCVKDVYTTQTGSRFVEIACLVAGARADSVIVGAAPPSIWATESPTIERAIAGLTT